MNAVSNSTGTAGAGVKLRPDLYALLAFAAGAGAKVPVQLFGQIFLSELILILVIPLALGRGALRGMFQNRVAVGFVFTALVSLLGYIVSDIFAGSSSDGMFRALTI